MNPEPRATPPGVNPSRPRPHTNPPGTAEQFTSSRLTTDGTRYLPETYESTDGTRTLPDPMIDPQGGRTKFITDYPIGDPRRK